MTLNKIHQAQTLGKIKGIEVKLLYTKVFA